MTDHEIKAEYSRICEIQAKMGPVDRMMVMDRVRLMAKTTLQHVQRVTGNTPKEY